MDLKIKEILNYAIDSLQLKAARVNVRIILTGFRVGILIFLFREYLYLFKYICITLLLKDYFRL